MELDHVLIAVTNLEAAAREFETRHRLSSVEGGRHLAWGTANRIVPLGSSYIELIAVVDEAVAGDSAFGRWVAGGASPPRGPRALSTRSPSRSAGAASNESFGINRTPISALCSIGAA